MSADAVPAIPTTGAPAARRPQRATDVTASVIGALVGRDLRRFFRQRSRIVGSVAQPLILWAVLALTIAISLVIAATSSDVQALAYAQSFFRMWRLDANDSWGPMSAAIEQLRADPQTPLYQKIFFTDLVKFQYPISSLLPLDLAQRASGLSWDTLISLLNRLSWYGVWAVGVLSWRLFVAAETDASGARAQSAAEEIALLWPMLALAILFYPLGRSWALGQVQTFMTLLCALALLLWQARRPALAGVCIGLCCAIKPQLAVLILWGLLRRQWHMAAAAAMTFAVLALAAGTRYGFHHYLDYLSVLSFLSQRGEAYFPNQSVNGLLNRLLFNGTNLQFELHAFPDFNVFVYAGTLAASVAILGAALFWRWRERPGALDLALVMLAATMASPIAWEHHYGLLLPIFALAAPYCLAYRPFGRLSGLVLLAAFVVAGERLDITNRLAATPLNVLQSYLFFAALVMLAMLLRLVRTEPPLARF